MGTPPEYILAGFLCCILELVRTHFAACGGEEPPREILKMRRSRADDNFKFFFGGKL